MRSENLILIFTAALMLLFSCEKKTSGEYKSDPEATVKEMRDALGQAETYMVQYEIVNRVGGVVGTTISTQWVDVKNDVMVMESETTTVENGVTEKQSALTINKDGMFYMINLSDKSGIKTPTDYSYSQMMEEDSDESRMSFREMIEQDGGRVLKNESFLGLDCLVAELDQGDGNVVTMWYYKGIPLKTESAQYSLKALKYEEGIKVPKEKLEIPEGIDFQ